MPHFDAPGSSTEVGDCPLAITVRAATCGDQRAWDVLVQRFTPAIRRAARMYRLAPHEVDDVVQACWLQLLVHIRSLHNPEAVGAWLVTTARRQALHLRQREVREVLTDDPEPADRDAPDRESPEGAVVERERERELRAALTRLPGRQRALLETMVSHPDDSYVEISRALGMPVGSIGPTRERGLQRLRGDLRLMQFVKA